MHLRLVSCGPCFSSDCSNRADNTGMVWLSVYQGLTTEGKLQRLGLVHGEMRSLCWYKKYFLIPHLGTLWRGDIDQSRKWEKKGTADFYCYFRHCLKNKQDAVACERGPFICFNPRSNHL